MLRRKCVGDGIARARVGRHVMCALQLKAQLAEQQTQLEDADKRHKLFVQRARRAPPRPNVARARTNADLRPQRGTCRRDGGGCCSPRAAAARQGAESE
jgi:hypothetical protein